MVRRQLAGRGIEDARVLEAMRSVPREAFVPESYRASAYSDQALPISGGQTVSQPYVIALIFQALALRGDERVLEVGTGSGYSTAVLARLAAEVVSVDRDPALVAGAGEALTGLPATNVTVLTTDGNAGVPEYAPYDAVAVHAAVPELPAALSEQLRTGGRVVAPVSGAVGDQLRAFTKTEDGMESSLLDAVRFVPMVAGLPGAR
jgi:protein-L-isoaspartate(D-aspartate) O-methyltransferase